MTTIRTSGEYHPVVSGHLTTRYVGAFVVLVSIEHPGRERVYGNAGDIADWSCEEAPDLPVEVLIIYSVADPAMNV